MITTLSQLVAQVESNNVVTAIRYEPNWRYITPALIAQCKKAHMPAFMNDTTARAIMSMSYGKYQIMGSVLYELGYKGTLMNFATNVTLQDAWFEVFIDRRTIAYTLTEIVNDKALRERFALRYNGDAKVYSARLLTVYNQFKSA